MELSQSSRVNEFEQYAKTGYEKGIILKMGDIDPVACIDAKFSRCKVNRGVIVIIRMSMVSIVNDQISVIITGLPGIYVNVCHITILGSYQPHALLGDLEGS